jgi:hypothetical protein
MAEVFKTINEAMGSYDEAAAPNNLPDYDDDGDQPKGQGDPRPSDRQQEQGDTQRPASEQPEDQDDLDKLLSDLDPEAGSEEGEGEEDQGDPNAPQTLAEDTLLKLPNGTTKKYGDVLREAAEIETQRGQLGEERQRFDTARTEVRKQYEDMQGNMQVLAQIAQALMPQEPSLEMMQQDLYGYNILKHAYDKQAAMISQIVGMHQNGQQQMTAQQQQELKTFKMEQAQKLVQRDPRFGRDDFWSEFQKDMYSIGPRVYGYSADELREGMLDHRQYEVMRDAIAYQKIKAAAAARKGAGKHADARQRGANQQFRDQPTGRFAPAPQGRVVTGSGSRGRVDPRAMQRQQAQQRFEKNPTLKNAVDLLD